MKDRKLKTPTVRFKLPSIATKLPKLWAFRVPLPGGLYMGGGKLIIGSMTTVGLGFIASMFLLISTGDQEITWPMAGAEYNAPSMVGSRVVDAEFPAEASQTLKINLPAGLRVDEIVMKDVELGKGGLTDAFKISGTSTNDRLSIGTLTIRDSEFPTFDISNASIHTINATSSVQVAGHTVEPTMGTSTMVTIGSSRGAVSYEASDMVVDRVLILMSSTSTPATDVYVGEIVLDNVDAYTGGFNLDWATIGTLNLENVMVGDDGDINSADFFISSSVTVNTMNDGIVDKPVDIR
jgi:hypothetical protein